MTHEEKKDYTYVALLDAKTSHAIKRIQVKLDKAFGRNVRSWQPHTTISFGNLLSRKDLEDVKEGCRKIAAKTKPFDIFIDRLAIDKEVAEEKTYHYITLKIRKSKQLDALSREMVKIAEKYEVPYDKFSAYRFHVTLGKYAITDLDRKEVKEMIGDTDSFNKIRLSGFSIFIATINNPKMKSAKEVTRFDFG